MPKSETGISSRSFYSPTLSYRIPDNTLINTRLRSPKYKTQVDHNDRDTALHYQEDQIRQWLQEAFLRSRREYKLQRPLVDRFDSEGRTIYTAHLPKELKRPTSLPERLFVSQHSPLKDKGTSISLSARTRYNGTLYPCMAHEGHVDLIPEEDLFIRSFSNEKDVLVAFEAQEAVPRLSDAELDTHINSSRPSTHPLSWPSSSSATSPPVSKAELSCNGMATTLPMRMDMNALEHSSYGYASMNNNKDQDADPFICQSIETSFHHYFNLFINTEECCSI